MWSTAEGRGKIYLGKVIRRVSEEGTFHLASEITEGSNPVMIWGREIQRNRTASAKVLRQEQALNVCFQRNRNAYWDVVS